LAQYWQTALQVAELEICPIHPGLTTSSGTTEVTTISNAVNEL